MTRFTRRGSVILIGVLAALVVVASARGSWVTGRATETAMGGAAVSAPGTTAAPGLVGLALVLGAAMLALALARGVLRRVVLVVAAAAALGVAAMAVRALSDPAAILAPVAASASGRSGTVPVTAHATSWPVIGLVGGALGVAAAVLGLLGVRRWPDHTAGRYDEPAAGSGDRGERVDSTWDALSAGEDPTLGGGGSVHPASRPDTIEPTAPKEPT